MLSATTYQVFTKKPSSSGPLNTLAWKTESDQFAPKHDDILSSIVGNAPGIILQWPFLTAFFSLLTILNQGTVLKKKHSQMDKTLFRIFNFIKPIIPQRNQRENCFNKKNVTGILFSWHFNASHSIVKWDENLKNLTLRTLLKKN